jgi:hypothetical protein
MDLDERAEMRRHNSLSGRSTNLKQSLNILDRVHLLDPVWVNPGKPQAIESLTA